jgi:uncharacterized membrane protein YgdD (TMEM256/DUF423 family)
MPLFQPRNNEYKSRHERLYALYEIAYTAVDFLAAAFFILGSIFFFREATATLATWLFLIGSILFAIKPTIHLVRELHMMQKDKVEKLAKRGENE